MKKQIIITILFIILLSTIVYCTAPTVTHYGQQIFSDGITIKDANTVTIDPNGLAIFKNCTIRNGNFTVTDANSVAKFSVDPNNTTITRNNIQTTSTAGLTLQNTTASTVGVPVQYSPALNFYGSAWDTDANSVGYSDTWNWKFENIPTSESTTSSVLKIGYSKNGSAYIYPFSFSSSQYINTINISASGAVSAGTYLQSQQGLTTTSADGCILNNNQNASSGTPVRISPRLRFTGFAWNTTGAGLSESSSWIMENLPVSGTTPSSLLKFGYSANGGAYSYPITFDNSGQITAAADTDTTFTFGRGKMGLIGSNADYFYIGHYDNFTTENYSFYCNASGDTSINAKNGKSLYLSNNNTTIATLTSSGLTMSAGKTISSCNVEPIADDTYYLGKNDDDTAKAYKGVILKDTTNGKYYRIEVINGVVTATDLTD